MKINSDKIKKIMSRKMMTQKELSEITSICRATITNALGKGSCSIPTVTKIASALCVDPVEIMEL